jgi:hypothetical protein
MSTRAFSQDQCPDQESLVSFLYDEFDGTEALDRRSLTKHLETCERCARMLASLGGVRQRLRAWEAPDTSPLAFRMASDGSTRHASGAAFGWAAWMKPAFPLAAAAAIVLGAALGLARLDVQYDKDGFRIRTGWGHDVQAAGGTVTPALGVTSATPSIAGVTNFLSPVQNQNRPITQQDLQAFAQTLRQEMAASAARLQAQDASNRGTTVASASASEVAFLKRVQQLIDQSEVRQQQNLSLRVTELTRDFDLQRRSDLAQIEQGFGKLAGQREVDAQQQRLLLNAIRTSQQVPVAPR